MRLIYINIYIKQLVRNKSMQFKIFSFCLLINLRTLWATDSYINSIENDDIKFLVQQIMLNPACEDYYDAVKILWKPETTTMLSLPSLPIEHTLDIKWAPLYILHGLYNLEFGKTEENNKQAFDLFEKASIKGNLNEAYYQLSKMYNKGIGVEQDLSKSFELNIKAAVKGNFKAQEDFAHGYVEAQVDNYQSTFENLCLVCRSKRRLPNQDYHKYQLAFYYFRGQGTIPDWQAAHAWLDQIQIADPELTRLIESERERYPIGYIDYVKTKTPKDYKITKTFSEWLDYKDLLAKKYNNPVSQYLRATALSRSHSSTQQDINEAIICYEMADRNNFAPATFSLAILLANKQKVSSDNPIIKIYLTKALKYSLDTNEKVLIRQNLDDLNNLKLKKPLQKSKTKKQNEEEVELILKQKFFDQGWPKEHTKKNKIKQKKTKIQAVNLKSNLLSTKSSINRLPITNQGDQYLTLDKDEVDTTNYSSKSDISISNPESIQQEATVKYKKKRKRQRIKKFKNQEEQVVYINSKKTELNTFEKNDIDSLDQFVKIDHNLAITSFKEDNFNPELYSLKFSQVSNFDNTQQAQLHYSTIESVDKLNKFNFEKSFDECTQSLNELKDVILKNKICRDNEILNKLAHLERQITNIKIRSVESQKNEYRLRELNFNLTKIVYSNHKYKNIVTQ